jgi:UDP-glucuronate 4-epimerase
MKKVLITGCAGFIGFHLCCRILDLNKYKVYGIDNLNNYYDVKLKRDRLKILKKNKSFKFYKINIENQNKIKNNFHKIKYDFIIHLAAQAGVRHSISSPEPYLESNIVGFFNVLNSSKNINLKHFIYASTSSVYGDSTNFPLNEADDTSKPNSFYAATKKSNEVMAHSFSHIYNLRTTGLRFFTVYGPFGRPDMALYKFTEGIINNKKIPLYNKGDHIRDFTYIDDVVEGIIKVLSSKKINKQNYEILNIGSGNPQKLKLFLDEIERELGKKSKKLLKKFQKGDVYKTHADVKKISKNYQFKPKFSIKIGIKNFIKWYKNYHTK